MNLPDWWPVFGVVACCLFIPMTIILYALSSIFMDFFEKFTGWRQ